MAVTCLSERYSDNLVHLFSTFVELITFILNSTFVKKVNKRIYFCGIILHNNFRKAVVIVSNRIKEMRKKKKLTLKQLSEKTGISISSLSAYEKEKNEKGHRSPKIDKWIQLADFFDVPISYLQGISDYTNEDSKEIERLTPMMYSKDGKVNKKVLYKIADIDSALTMSEAIKQDFKDANQFIDMLFQNDKEKKAKYKKIIATSKVPEDGVNFPEPVSTYNFLLVIISEMFFNAQSGDKIAQNCIKKLNRLIEEYDDLTVKRAHKKYIEKNKN